MKIQGKSEISKIKKGFNQNVDKMLLNYIDKLPIKDNVYMRCPTLHKRNSKSTRYSRKVKKAMIN